MDSQILDCFGWFRVAVQALVVIAETDGACSSTVIAQELRAHATFCRRVIAHLVPAHLVVAREGRDGGYRLARPAHSITLAEVYRAVKPVSQPERITASQPENSRVQHMLAEVATEVEHALLAKLAGYTLASLMETPLPSRPHS